MSMSDWGDNTHVATAKFRQEGVHEWQSREGETDATLLAAVIDAQTEATLALAYEQRTANLIAVMADGETNGVMPEIDYNEVAKQIKERLGL